MSTNTNNTTQPVLASVATETTPLVPVAKSRLPILVPSRLPKASAPIPVPTLLTSRVPAVAVGKTSSGLPIIRRTAGAPEYAPALLGAVRVPTVPTVPIVYSVPMNPVPVLSSFEEDIEEEMRAIQAETDEEQRFLAAHQVPVRGNIRNPKIRELVKGFRRIAWTSTSDGTIKSGRITRRNKDTISVDGDDGQSWKVGYGAVYDVEPPARAEATSKDLLKAALSRTNYVSWNGKIGPQIGRIMRRNEKTMSVLPLGEIDSKKYWTVPYNMLTPVSDEQAAEALKKLATSFPVPAVSQPIPIGTSKPASVARTSAPTISSFDPKMKYSVTIDSCDAEDGRMTNQYDSAYFMGDAKLNLDNCDGDISYDTFTGERLNKVPAKMKTLMLKALALSKNHQGVKWCDSLLTVYENAEN